MGMEFISKLPIPKEIKEQHPISEEIKKLKADRDKEIRKVFTGESDKFILIIGPCSADSEEPVLAYLEKISKVAEKVKDKIIIIPRVYTNKPRTIGDGYKGMLHQPDANGNPDILKGILAIRQLQKRAIEVSGLTCADELLYPDTYRYISDLLSYVAVGARSTENQQHRLTASGLDIPVGMKNPTSGDISVALNSVTAAQLPQSFIYRGWEVKSTGNDLAHIILRGYVNKHNENQPNYHYEYLKFVFNEYEKRNLKNPACIIDCNHANSGKKYLEQIRIANEIVYSMNYDKDIKKLIKGLMIESYLEDGSQPVGGGVFGKSITDPCLGFEKSEKFIYELAEKLK